MANTIVKAKSQNVKFCRNIQDHDVFAYLIMLNSYKFIQKKNHNFYDIVTM